MGKKLVILIGVIILVIIISTLIYFIARPTPYYTENPEDWIDDKTRGVKEINIRKATRGAGFLNEAGLQYDDGKILTVFEFDGNYEGNYFSSRSYYHPITREPLLMITPEMRPGNDVLEAFIIEYIKNDEVTAYIYVDEDWKQKIGKTNIIWGKTFQNIKKFEYNAISEGVYMDTIIDDSESFDDDYTERYGGIIVGNADMNNVIYDDFKGKTIIMTF